MKVRLALRLPCIHSQLVQASLYDQMRVFTELKPMLLICQSRRKAEVVSLNKNHCKTSACQWHYFAARSRKRK
jgi:hypothetical protein